MLKSIFTMTAISVVGLSLVACTASEQTVADYGVGGAALGAVAGTVATGGTAEGARRGAAVGAIAGTVTGVAAAQRKAQEHAPIVMQQAPSSMMVQQTLPPHTVVQQPALCTYQDRRGRLYQAPCPQPVSPHKLCTFTDGTGKLFQAPCHSHPR
ncbi:hypothetical protein [Bartonella sp. A05]|uniref:hypothetical protein n=1 Tax=Bartonella sp. A05 TaxID=2967261 RepID=UPI0022A92BBA|nr:hypothetical protein [Bartonella sp. A05]MCZ2203642.1 hypothetical protein [Bartonella sp. A05]